MTQISIIVPTYQEEEQIADLVQHLQQVSDSFVREIIVVDGGSRDTTTSRAREAGARGILSEKGRARQLNAGARVASGEILYFLQADAFPPEAFDRDIAHSVQQGYAFGHFRQEFLSENVWVKLNNYLSRVRGLIASGGDQSLFILRSFYQDLGGFDESLVLMEDYDLVKRARKKAAFCKIPRSLRVIDRKYCYNAFWRVNLSNALVYSLYCLGVHPNRLARLYQLLIRGPRYQELRTGRD